MNSGVPLMASGLRERLLDEDVCIKSTGLLPTCLSVSLCSRQRQPLEATFSQYTGLSEQNAVAIDY